MSWPREAGQKKCSEGVGLEGEGRVLCLQETKVSYMDKRLASVLWGSSECEWVFSGADGASGGLCCVWDPNVFERKELWGEKGLLGVAGLWEGIHVNIVNVYAPCKAEEKT